MNLRPSRSSLRVRSTRASLTLIAAAALVGATADGPTTAATTPTPAPSSVPPSLPAVVIDPGDGGNYAPTIDPADFVDVVDNPYYPLAAGARWEYDTVTDEGTEHDVVEVTGGRYEVMGVSTFVVHDVVSVADRPVEDTLDYFAQDRAGAVWYFGESVREYDDQGQLAGSAGSWEAGVNGALPGVIMPADPTVGDAYRQEYQAGVAEDMGEIIAVGEHVDVPFGAYDHVVVTRDWSPLEPDVVEQKYYAPGVGVVRENTIAGGQETSDLVHFTPGG
jgi:hypothetical protein